MSSSDRQRIERVAGSRRAKLTPAPGTTAEPIPADEKTTDAAPPAGREGQGNAASDAPGPNDERLRRDVPPHY
ncbi:hypothetical protein JNB63_20295 [Microbacterium trichothecenolyticum]|uniref:Uncharacterized protein n=1 Tax=Microbacterium ureisolvens TaxID=2781186 RepID=A0ABS7I6D4_9MICO|nr:MULTISPECIES: hypothetical protein [Microbacterium]MBW9111508.1 hypothetical protein [Microbacterium ureisolvens]MBW9122435.1 hypothetical protein [Microbacterium trichothecenolyticum]